MNSKSLLVLLSGALALTACATRTEHAHTTTPPPTRPPPRVEPPPPAPAPLEASIASVTLGDDCPAPTRAPSSAAPAQRAAPAQGMPSADAPVNGRFAPGFCQRTALQLAVSAPVNYVGAQLEVTQIRLMTMEGELIQTLDVRDVTVFRDGTYVPWDLTVAGGEHNISLQTSGPDWGSIGGGFGQSFRVEMDFRAGAQTETLEFAPASREAMVVT